MKSGWRTHRMQKLNEKKNNHLTFFDDKWYARTVDWHINCNSVVFDGANIQMLCVLFFHRYHHIFTCTHFSHNLTYYWSVLHFMRISHFHIRHFNLVEKKKNALLHFISSVSLSNTWALESLIHLKWCRPFPNSHFHNFKSFWNYTDNAVST